MATVALGELIRSGDRDAVLQAIRKGADVDAAEGDGSRPLHWAAYRVDVELVRELLKRGAKANVKNQLGSTPLAEAVKVSSPEIVALLLGAGADVEAANEDGQTALMLAARNGSVPIGTLLLDRGAKVNAREQWREQTALMWAAAESQPAMVELLIARGADVSARAAVNDWGNQVTNEPRAQYRPAGGLTPLLYAARAGGGRSIEALLKAGAAIDVPTPEGVTPLMTAIDNLRFDAAMLLLDRGANPHIWDWWGRTALYVATDMNSIRAQGRVGFGSAGEDLPDPPVFGGGGSEGGRSAAAGVEGGTQPATALDVMRRLLAAGVNVNPQLNMHRPGRGGNTARFVDDLLTVGATPLMCAAISRDNAAISVLLEHGAKVDMPNVTGATPFMAAAGLGVNRIDTRGNFTGDVEGRSLATLEVLRKAGADVNARLTDTSSRTARIARPSSMTERQGQTALYGAISWSWVRVVKYLLDNGARVDIKDDKGRTPLDAANGNGGGGRPTAAKSPEVIALVTAALARTKSRAPA